MPGPGARALLDDLDRTDLSLQHQKSLLGFLEEAGGGSEDSGEPTQTSRRPVRSPEAAEEERHSEEALVQLAADAIQPAREQVADLERRRQGILTAMAEGGCFEGRWVGKGDRAVYLQRKEVHVLDKSREDRKPRFELHEGPWVWVEGAPEGEDPRETLARGEILDHRIHARNELCILLGVPTIVVCLGASLFPGALLLTLVAALVVVLLLRLRQGRRRLLDHISTGTAAGRRKVRELAAVAQLDSIQRGNTDVPPLKELEEAFAHSLAGGSAGEKHLRQRLEHRRPFTTVPEKQDQASGGNGSGEDSKGSSDTEATSVSGSVGMTRAAVLLSLAGSEKNLGELLAHIRAFSGTAFAPGPAELGGCLRDLQNDGLVRQTEGEPPFVRYKITPDGGRELHARMPSEPAGSLQEYETEDSPRAAGAGPPSRAHGPAPDSP